MACRPARAAARRGSPAPPVRHRGYRSGRCRSCTARRSRPGVEAIQRLGQPLGLSGGRQVIERGDEVAEPAAAAVHRVGLDVAAHRLGQGQQLALEVVTEAGHGLGVRLARQMPGGELPHQRVQVVAPVLGAAHQGLVDQPQQQPQVRPGHLAARPPASKPPRNTASRASADCSSAESICQAYARMACPGCVGDRARRGPSSSRSRPCRSRTRISHPPSGPAPRWRPARARAACPRPGASARRPRAAPPGVTAKRLEKRSARPDEQLHRIEGLQVVGTVIGRKRQPVQVVQPLAGGFQCHREVTSSFRPGAWASHSSSSGRPSSRCSVVQQQQRPLAAQVAEQLQPGSAGPLNTSPTAAATFGTSRSARLISASGTSHTPSAKASTCRPAASSARRSLAHAAQAHHGEQAAMRVGQVARQPGQLLRAAHEAAAGRRRAVPGPRRSSGAGGARGPRAAALRRRGPPAPAALRDGCRPGPTAGVGQDPRGLHRLDTQFVDRHRRRCSYTCRPGRAARRPAGCIHRCAASSSSGSVRISFSSQRSAWIQSPWPSSAHLLEQRRAPGPREVLSFEGQPVVVAGQIGEGQPSRKAPR